MKYAVVEQQVLGMVSTNTWFLKNKQTNELLLVDPADQPERIQQKIMQMGAKPVGILLTHGHFDHIMASVSLRDHYQIPVYAYQAEEGLLANARENLSGSWAAPYTMEADHLVKDKEHLQLAGFDIEVIYTPGHTVGSCCYYLKEEEILFSGDTLFCCSVGRTDFPTSSTASMKKSIAHLLTTLPENTKVFPGHNEETTIGYEKRYNPFA